MLMTDNAQLASCMNINVGSQQIFTINPYIIETPFNAFAIRADPDQAAPVRAA